MKTSSSYQNEPLYVLSRQKRMSDVVDARKTATRVNQSFAPMRTKKDIFPVLPKQSCLDGIRTKRKPLLKQLRTHSSRDIFWTFIRKGELFVRSVRRTTSRLIPDIAPHKRLYASLTLGVIFGVVSMGFVETFFGPGVFVRASTVDRSSSVTEASASSVQNTFNADDITYNSGADIFFEYFNEAEDEKYKDNIREMVKGYPIEAMLSYIFEQDRLTMAFLIGIAKKESNWGKRVPVLDDQDCFNYWGYRGVRRLMGTGGHTCFNSREDAVTTVAKRINTLVHSEELNTPEKMIIWKCGFSCNGHSRESVKKWIADVDMYFSMAGGDDLEEPIPVR
ncbi:MAG: hypothetical protein GW815_01340 [Candidatus Moranbacteria bacterium]|nr:hypothetical protein [Candidatus Moranbacteria bacterium]OIQ03087.1 MAG: hypothetical protein AUK58_02150 [Candidatus Moranbacteria bacterium CG2_30_41_165]PIP25690.1 MAG: hypothetical protein COX32_01930 [Candidatus Moranbacteria bacterium CG23_combo_of_CG06-09_8_20_14_all_41_28]PIV86088.1 MAG: hypothetical protein COW50_03525 [Candidatus Moranbacteria bacterium CG17_big_fil_post_rev_8_21_14_2_50_41_107]PIW94042.1 MAG: hypothetical protein COZ86_03175 [Candidatus Moranbacteria bacterium CG_